ncbi:unnamed protein product, partial [Closterium sp. NIES-54]
RKKLSQKRKKSSALCVDTPATHTPTLPHSPTTTTTHSPSPQKPTHLPTLLTHTHPPSYAPHTHPPTFPHSPHSPTQTCHLPTTTHPHSKNPPPAHERTSALGVSMAMKMP